jgi:uncharacterized protein YigA (DUF484 family)
MNRAETIDTAQAAAEAVKAYLRIHRTGGVEDTELLALLLPDRFPGAANVHDYQNFVIERLKAENAALRAERDGLLRGSDRAGVTREGVRRLVLKLIDAGGLEETAQVALGAASALGVDMVALGVEGEAGEFFSNAGFSMLPEGVVETLIERDAAGSVIKHAHATLLGGAIVPMPSTAVFRLRRGSNRSALYVVGMQEPECFNDGSETREIAYFVRALEHMIRAWLDRSPS